MDVINCPHCQRQILSTDEHEGRRVRCPHCSGQFTMPVKHQQAARPVVRGQVAFSWQKPIAMLLTVIAVLLVAILIAVVVKRPGLDVSMDQLKADELKSLAGLQMLAVAEDMKPEYSKRIWILATRLAHDGYVHEGKPIEMDIRDITMATNGAIGLQPPNNGIFPIDWKLMRPVKGEKQIAPSWLSCHSAGGFCYEMHDRICSEWSKAIHTFPRDDFQAAGRMMTLAASLHSKYSSNKATFADEVKETRSYANDMEIEYHMDDDPDMFSLVISKDGPSFRFELSVHQMFDGTNIVLRIECIDPDSGYQMDG